MAAGLIAALILSVAWNPPPTPQGWVLLAITGVTALTLLYVLREYLRSQWSLQIFGEELVVSQWSDRYMGNRTTAVPLAAVRRFVLRRPDELDVEASDVIIHVGTFWWREREFDELSNFAQRVRIPIVEERPSLPGWLNKPYRH